MVFKSVVAVLLAFVIFHISFDSTHSTDEEEIVEPNCKATGGGCYKELYCWRYCSKNRASSDWCYTAQYNDGNRTGCTQDSECNKCWYCAEKCG